MGYQHGKTVFDVWRRSGVVEKMLKDRHQEEFHNTQSKNNVRMEGGEKHMGMLLRINDKKAIRESSAQSNNRVWALFSFSFLNMTIDFDERFVVYFRVFFVLL